MPSPPPLEGKKGTARGGLSRRRAISAPAGKKAGEKKRFPPAAGAEKSVAAGFFRACGPAGGAEHAAWRRNKRFCAWLWRNPPGRMRGRRCGPVALIRIGKRGRSPCRIFPSRRAAGGERRRGGNGGGRGRAVMDSRGRPQAHPAGVGKGSIVPCTCISA